MEDIKTYDPIDALEDLLNAYPHQVIPKPTMELYISKLSGLDPNVLMGAVNTIITSDPSNFFPSLSRILEVYREIDAKRQIQRSERFKLNRKRQSLEDRYHQDHILDEEEWLSLVEEFRAAGRHQGANKIMAKLGRFQETLKLRSSLPDHLAEAD